MKILNSCYFIDLSVDPPNRRQPRCCCCCCWLLILLAGCCCSSCSLTMSRLADCHCCTTVDSPCLSVGLDRISAHVALQCSVHFILFVLPSCALTTARVRCRPSAEPTNRSSNQPSVHPSNQSTNQPTNQPRSLAHVCARLPARSCLLYTSPSPRDRG